MSAMTCMFVCLFIWRLRAFFDIYGNLNAQRGDLPQRKDSAVIKLRDLLLCQQDCMLYGILFSKGFYIKEKCHTWEEK